MPLPRSFGSPLRACARGQAEDTADQPVEQAAAALRFDIQRYKIEGNVLLKPAVIERLVAPYTGKQKNFSDIQRALEQLEISYRDLGYGTVQIILPEQNIALAMMLFIAKLRVRS